MRRWLAACDRVGEGARLEGRPAVQNEGSIEVGDRFHLASVPRQSHLVTGPSASLLIGDDVSIGHGASIAAYAAVHIGSGTRIAPYVVIMDTDFHVVGEAGARYDASPVSIGREVQIASRVTILRGSVIQDRVVVSAGSVVSGSIAEGLRVSGVPARPQTSVALAEDVPAVVMRTFGLAHPPDPTDGPRQIPAWDSLGALRLLVALEESFGVNLDGDRVLRVASVRDLAELLDRARPPL